MLENNYFERPNEFINRHITRVSHDRYCLQLLLLFVINKLGYPDFVVANKALNIVKKPLLCTAAATIILTTFNANEAKAQTNNFKNTQQEITETGYGNLVVQDENSQGIEGATVTWTPVNVPGDSIPEPYAFVSNYEGISAYEVLVFHDNETSTQNNQNIEVIQARPNPSTDFTLNYVINNSSQASPVQIRSINGQIVKEIQPTGIDGNVAVYHADLSEYADGAYIATAVIGDKFYSDKLIKVNNQRVGNLGSSAKPTNNNFKSTLNHEAVYEVTISAPGYHDIVDERTVLDGDNGLGWYTLISDAPAPIDNLDLEGYVWKLENTSSSLANVQARAIVNSTNEVYTATSDANGHFLIEGLPLGEEITFDIGGLADRYSFTSTSFTTPDEIENPADSINSNFGAVLPLKLASSSAQHIKDQTKSGTRQQIIEFYLGNSFNNTQKNTIRNYFITLSADEGGVYQFQESSTQLNNTGINIEYGTYNTNPSAEGVETPLGDTFYPILYANSTMGTSQGYNSFTHEIKRALGFAEVAWIGVESVMETPVEDYTQEDKEIAEFVERPYWNAVYQENKTWLDLNRITEDMNSKSTNSNNSNTNINTYNSSSSYGDMEFDYQSE